MAIPLLNTIDIEGKDVTSDALLTQRKIAEYLVTERHAHYHFTVKGNQRGLLEDVALWFQDRKKPDFVQYAPPDHGRIEIRKIWTTTKLNGYLDFPHVGQAFLIERHSKEKKTGKSSCKLTQSASSMLIGATGPLRIAATIFLIGTTMKTEVASALAMARRISPGFVASPSELSNPRVCAA